MKMMAKQYVDVIPRINSFFIPAAKHCLRRHNGQKRRVFTSILQCPSNRHFICWNTCNNISL